MQDFSHFEKLVNAFRVYENLIEIVSKHWTFIFASRVGSRKGVVRFPKHIGALHVTVEVS